MPRCLTVAPHLAIDDVEHRYRACRDAVERSHWQMVWLVAGSHHVPAVARLTGYSVPWVREIIRRYNASGPDALGDGRAAHRGGNPPLLSPARKDELAAALDGPAPDGGLWTGPKVAAWMAERLGRPIHPQRGWEAVRALGLTLQVPRPRATHADPAAQAAFKKGGSRPRSMR
ncbi:MAG: winged helix-turn-helix domain-containing protein [Chloroflexia bacterium]|nr:winged helix-turn-helix domain-containing protein [Chloroflexia bacterium]